MAQVLLTDFILFFNGVGLEQAWEQVSNCSLAQACTILYVSRSMMTVNLLNEK